MRRQGFALLYMDITQIEKKEKRRRRDKTYTVALGKWKQLVGIGPPPPLPQGMVLGRLTGDVWRG
jgi:hypothetical protein